MKSHKPRGWHSRGYLPHFDGGAILQSITFHLGDSTPNRLLKNWKAKLDDTTDRNELIGRYQRFEGYLDQGYGRCHLKKKEIAQIVQDTLFFFDGKKYKLIS